MPLSDAEKTKARLYLGRPARFYQVDTDLENAMASIDGDPNAVVEVQALLARCADIDTKLAAADARQKLTVAEDIEFAGTRELIALRSQGRQAVGRIAAIFGVGIGHDVFSPSAPTRGGNNLMKMG